MTPTLFGRIQTRLFVVLIVGGLWTLAITPLLPLQGTIAANAKDTPLGDVYKLTYAALLIVAIFGAVVWEPIYHLLMQFRWEKDWPALFQLLQIVPEGISTWLLLHVPALNPIGDSGEASVPGPTFIVLFVTTWIVTWLFANGPMKIFFIRWRFSGGRII